MAQFELLALPNDILITLPDYLHDIEDFKNLTTTCRALRIYLSSTSSRTIFRLAASASRTFFRPSPHFLVATTARQLGAWAALSPENELELRTAFRDGIEGVLELCLEHTAGLTMERIRELHMLRFSTINPVVDLIDKCVGEQWYATPNFWNGGVDDAYTIDVDPSETFFHLAIYGGLFAGSFDAFLDPAGTARQMAVETRLEYVKYCVPDWACYACADSARDVKDEDGKVDPRRAVEPVGPYLPFARARNKNTAEFAEHGNQVGLLHLLESTRWNPSWAAVRAIVGGDFEEEWKQELWEAVVMFQGLEGMEMIRPGRLEPWRERLQGWRAKIEAPVRAPREVTVGRQRTFEYPYYKGDLETCTSGYVGGT